MTCRQTDPWIIPYAAGQPVPAEVSAHIAGCELCRNLAAIAGRPHSHAAPNPAQLQKIKSELFAHVEPVNPLAPEAAFVAALLAISMLAVAIGVFDLGTAGWYARNAIQRAVIFPIVAGGLGFFAFLLVRQIAPGSRVFVSAPRSVVGILAIFAIVFGVLFEAHREQTFVATGLVCLRIGLECAVAVALMSWFVIRRGAVLNRVLAGAVSGALAGLSGLALLEIFCPNLDAYHILAWHLGAAVASTIAGIIAGLIARAVDKPARAGFQRRFH
jgi:hypothetical protein